MIARRFFVMSEEIVAGTDVDMPDRNRHDPSLCPEARGLKWNPMLHSAVLLAGGKSSRMGRDKGALLVEGEPLWQRQLNILRRTQPRELFISGPLDGPYANTGVRIVSDAEPHLGPLGGIAAALGECTTDWLLVLAVDLPFMRADYLLSL